MQDAIEISALSKRYSDFAALTDISATVAGGQVIGLLGHNGAGKSTLIKLILGLSAPTSGEIRVLGEAPTGANAHKLRRRIGYLPENAAFYGNLTGREVLAYLGALKHAPARQTGELLDRVGLSKAADRRVGTYSKGMRQRLGIAQALLDSPDLVLLDEPATGLDPQATRDLYAIIGELRAEGRSVLITSHLLAELEPHIDGAIILRHGQLLAAGSVGALRHRAGLPSMLLVRLGAQNGVDSLLSSLRGFDLLHRKRGDGRIEIEVPEHRKVEVLRTALSGAAISDVELKEPTLARLYDWLSADRREPAESVQ